MNDLRFAFRQLRKSPGFALVAIMTLALGIGVNTAMFSIINAVLLRPLPYPAANRIMALHESDAAGSPFAIALPNFLDWKRDNTVFESLALTRTYSYNLSGIAGRQAERVSAAIVTSEFFQVMGVAPQLGRTFTAEEDQSGAPRLVVISDRLWQRVFERDPAVLGRAVTFHNQLFTVIGVMPPAMKAPEETDAWFSLLRRADNVAWQNRANHPLMFGWGRLKPGVTIEQARSELATISARLTQLYPATNTNVQAVVQPLLEKVVGKYRTNLFLLLGAVSLVLLVACANLANLLAARGAARAREFAIRAAVGASRGQLVRQLLAECLLIACAGGAAGFLLAVWSRDALLALSPSAVARFQDVNFDPRVLAFTFLLATATTVLFGLLPAWQSSRVDLQLALQAGGRGSSDAPGARRTRDFLVVSEVALTLILLISAAVVLKSFARMQQVQLGFEPRHLLTARIDLPSSRYPGAEKVTAFTRALLEKVRALPGVTATAAGGTPPLFTPWQIVFTRDGAPAPAPGQEPEAHTEGVTGDYFATIGASLLRGRTLNEQDRADSPRVVVVDQVLAERYFPGEDPIGKRLSMDPDNNGEGNRAFEIVGIVAPLKFRGVEEMVTLPAIFFSLAQVNRNNLVLLARTAVTPASLEGTIRDLVASIDPEQPVFEVRSMLERVQETWAPSRFLSLLLLIFAGLALALSMIGLYGVLAFNTQRRSREIGVRIALGAQRGQIRALILAQGMRLLVVGLSLGLLGAFACARLLRSILFQVEAVDPVIYLGVCLLLALAATAACWFPARRASQLDPLVTLRAE